MPRKTSSSAYLLPLTLLAMVLSVGIPHMWAVFLALAAVTAAHAVAGMLGMLPNGIRDTGNAVGPWV